MAKIYGNKISDLNKLKLGLNSWMIYYSLYNEIKVNLSMSDKIKFIEKLLSPSVLITNGKDEMLYAKLNDKLRREYWHLQEMEIMNTKTL